MDTEPEMPLIQQNPFFKGSAVHSTYGGLGEGAEGDPPHGDRHSSQNYPRPPPVSVRADPSVLGSRRRHFPFPDRCVQRYVICAHPPQSARGSAEPPRGKFQSQPSLCLFSVLISGGHWPPPRGPCPQALFSRSWTSLAPPHTPSPPPQN